MNGDFQKDNLLKSMKINSLSNQNNNVNPLQFVSTPNFINLKNENYISDNIHNSHNNEQNNGLNNNILNTSENELFNFELDQSTESIINNQNISSQMPIENSSNRTNENFKNINSNNIQKYSTGAIQGQNLFSSLENGEEIQNNNEVLRYKEIIKNMEEKLKKQYLLNKEQNNYIEILKQTINSYLLKNENINIKNLDQATNQLNKHPVDILTEYTSFKLENEKIKKQLVMQQILYNDMKNEITNLKQENNILKSTSEKLSKENKTLQRIREEISSNYENLRNESDEIKNALLKYEEEFTNCQKNNNDFLRLKSVNSELTSNYEKQKIILNNLQNDFNKINKSNTDLTKYNEKLVKENQQLKRELFHKSNELDNINNKISNNINDIKENNDILLKEKNELINNIKNIENKNAELDEIKNNQKIEIDSLNKMINDKNNEIVKYLNEIQYLKNNNIYNIANNNNKGKLSSDINLDLIINNIQNELQEKNKLIEDLKTQNAKLIKENDLKENTIKDYIIKESNRKKELNNLGNEDKKFMEQIDRLNTVIKQKELEIYAFKNNEKSYNKIVDLSFQSIKEFVNKIKIYDEFKNNEESYINIDINDNNSQNNLFIRPLKEFVNKMSEENKNNNNYYNGNNIPLIEKIKKINIFTNIVAFQINLLYNKIKTMQQENKVLLNIKNKSKNNNTINVNEEINNSNINSFKENDNNLSLNLNLKKNNFNNNSESTPSALDMNSNNKFDFFDNLKKYNSNTNTIFVEDSNNDKQNIQNMKSISLTRNNNININNNQSENININLKSIFDENKTTYKTGSNSLNKREKIQNIISNINPKNEKEKEISSSEIKIMNNNIRTDKINLKVKEMNDYIFNNNEMPKMPKSFIFNDEDNYLNIKEKKNLKEDIPYNNKLAKKSRITLFKEEISNRKFINNSNKSDNKNIFLSIQTNSEMINESDFNKNMYKKNSQNSFSNNLNNISQISLKSNNSLSNNITFLNNNINISQPITNRSNNNLKINTKNQKKDFLNNRNYNQNVFDELNISYTSKNILNSHTIDSSHLNNNIIPSLNDNSFLNKNKIIDEKTKKNELYQKSINGLADEVMKPSFLKSDVSMTMLGGGLNNNNNNDSFLILAKNRLKKRNKKNDSPNFIEIKSNTKRNCSPFNRKNSNSKNRNDNNNNLHRNRSFLY